MWLPGTKGTTNGSGLYPVNFFSGKLPIFFGGQKIRRNPVRCGAVEMGRERAFQSENALGDDGTRRAEKFLDVLSSGARRDFQRRKDIGRLREGSEADGPL